MEDRKTREYIPKVTTPNPLMPLQKKHLKSIPILSAATIITSKG
jgi:hypothetical protein